MENGGNSSYYPTLNNWTSFDSPNPADKIFNLNNKSSSPTNVRDANYFSLSTLMDDIV